MFEGCLRRFEVSFGNQTVPKQPLGPPMLALRFLRGNAGNFEVGLGAAQFSSAIPQVSLCVLDCSLRRRKLSLRPLSLSFKVGRVNDGEHLPFLDDAVEIGMQLLNPARNLASDLDGDHCLQGSRGADSAAKRATLGLDGQILLPRILAGILPVRVTAPGSPKDQHCQDAILND